MDARFRVYETAWSRLYGRWESWAVEFADGSIRGCFNSREEAEQFARAALARAEGS